MSRSNHYRICRRCTEAETCWLHERPWSNYEHKPIREILGRRNWKRKDIYPPHSPKSFHNGPPRWWWQEQHSMARAVYRDMMRREEDPALPREQDLIDLWAWY